MLHKAFIQIWKGVFVKLACLTVILLPNLFSNRKQVNFLIMGYRTKVHFKAVSVGETTDGLTTVGVDLFLIKY